MNALGIKVGMPGVSDGTAPVFTVTGTGAVFSVGGANVIDLFPVYDVVYTNNALSRRTG